MNTLTNYFQKRLIEFGFPMDLNIEYSLSHCQGDGVAFYGDIRYEDFLNLFKHIYPNEQRKYQMFKRLISAIFGWEALFYDTISIVGNSFSWRYSHWNTMKLDAPCADDLLFFCDKNLQTEWYFPKQYVSRYKALWNDFIYDLQVYIQDVSRQLETEGYRIIESTSDQDDE
ncbi:hypothetical protein [Gallibacterium anatis]|uniref:hypothetical protein n=1 Tax=Gallibacterium anatis TaxID=750 RepID=UPI000802663D|nr:hypothetical protein [Gallibacterium anatis]